MKKEQMFTRRVVGAIVRTGKKSNLLTTVLSPYKMGEPTIYHALVVIFLEFFAWGLLTSPMINVLNETFPEKTFLMNGIVMGIKGFLSFLSAPLIGALSDMWGRKFFLLITVLFTCSPIPFMVINSWLYFVMIAVSGLFAVTFSVVFAYVADITSESERSAAYGLVSATFAASLVTSPALGAYISHLYGDNLVAIIATVIAALDVLFIMFFVPESLPEKLRITSSATTSLWETADPFASLKKVGRDKMTMMMCIAVFLSYLPEAGQYSCFFVYLRLVVGFSSEDVALFIAVVGLLSVVAQTAILACLMQTFNSKTTIMIGLLLEMIQLAWYGFGSQTWMMWSAGVLAGLSTITYPAISSYVSMYTDQDKQGLVQGMITGIRGLCNGIGPAMFGLIFSLFQVDLSHNMITPVTGGISGNIGHAFNRTHFHTTQPINFSSRANLIPGPPFLFGSLLVFMAMLVTTFIPELIQYSSRTSSKPSGDMFGFYGKPKAKDKLSSSYYYTNVDKDSLTGNDNDKHDAKMSDGSDTESRTTLREVSGSSEVTERKSKEYRKRGQSTCELHMPLMADIDQ
ncbi:Tetracycline resistance protein, class A [Halotydeus destructor]|nr:Tetracycline resistance protein, class A [Halotydeus destructor]